MKRRTCRNCGRELASSNVTLSTGPTRQVLYHWETGNGACSTEHGTWAALRYDGAVT